MNRNEQECVKKETSLDQIKNIFLSDHLLFSDMGFVAKDIRRGYAELFSPYNPLFSDKSGVMHRGVLVTLADTACGLAVFSALGEFAPIATVDLRVDYANPLRKGQDLEARIHCSYLGSSAAHVNGEVMAIENGTPQQVVARVTGIFAVNTPGKSFSENYQENNA